MERGALEGLDPKAAAVVRFTEECVRDVRVSDRTFAEARQHLPEREVAELVLKALPELSAKVPVEVRTKRLPAVVTGLRPRITVDVTLLSHAMSVVP